MKISLAHLHHLGIDFAVFDADAQAHTSSARAAVLAKLTTTARQSGLKIDKSALAYAENGRLSFYGTPDLVNFLASSGGVPAWTHTINVP